MINAKFIKFGSYVFLLVLTIYSVLNLMFRDETCTTLGFEGIYTLTSMVNSALDVRPTSHRSFLNDNE